MQLFLFAQSATILVASSFAYGFDSELVPPGLSEKALIVSLLFRSQPAVHIANLVQSFWVFQILYKITINTVKVSILLQFIRVFAVTWFQHCCWAMIGLCTTAEVVFFFVSLLQCVPVWTIWDRTAAANCINIGFFWNANAAWNIAADVVLLVSPCYWIWRLKITNRKKALVLMNFSFGLFVLVASIFRWTTLETSAEKADALAGTLVSTVWTQAESATAIICPCLPMLRPLLERFFPKLRDTPVPEDQQGVVLLPLPPRAMEPRAEVYKSTAWPPPGKGHYTSERLRFELSVANLSIKSQKAAEEDPDAITAAPRSMV